MDCTFEEALVQLEGLVDELENKDINLEEAISKYNEALRVSKICYEKLNEAKLIIANMEEKGADSSDKED